MKNLPSRAWAILLVTLLLGTALAHAQALQITGHGNTGPGGWNLTVAAQLNSNGATGTVSVLGGSSGQVVQIRPPANDACGCWCINARITEDGRDYRTSYYIRDVGDGLNSFDQFYFSGGDCSFLPTEAFFMVIREGNFEASQEDNVPPSVTWMQPADAAVFSHASAVVLTAQAADPDGSVSFVDYFADSWHIGRVAGSPTNTGYHFTWHPPRDGHFRLHAVAVDDKGGRGFSGAARIFVGDGNPGVLDLGTLEVGTIGHTFFDPNASSPPGIDAMTKVVWNFLVQQDQNSGGGVVLPSLPINWDTNSQFAVTISAPAGQKFQVQVPAGRAVGFGCSLQWESTRGGTSPYGSVVVNFGGLQGAAPRFTGAASVLSESHGFFGLAGLESTMVSNDFAFTSITLTGTVIPQRTGNGTEYYVPHLGSSLLLYYTTFETNDPGPFVSLVPLHKSAERIEALIQQISTNSYPSKVKRPLLISLRLCRDAMDRGDTRTALQLLTAFQHKVAAQIGDADVAYAQELITAVQAIIESLPSP